ncbi:hypothetical protein GCM10009716_09900 [Streptomyces sodiiphilus]|uniref:Methyltransferase type 12 domain-containing protein n=1 Tax=Streptomyces sodiiphilus TaxID=226217 RepID=A0ABP5A3G3_9ACTN
MLCGPGSADGRTGAHRKTGWAGQGRRGTMAGMDRQRISALAHQDHPVAAPLGDDSVGRLLGRAVPSGAGRLLDLGYAEGVWLERALTGRPGLRATGVDVDAAAVARGRERLGAAGLGARVALHAVEAREFASEERFDLVLCVGATHAFGGLMPTLAAIRGHLAPGGSVLVGDGFWEREPGERTLEAGFAADEYADLATTVARATDDGWTPLYGHVSCSRNGTSTSGRGAARSPAGPWTIPRIPAVGRPCGPRRRTGAPGCGGTAAPSGS